MKKTGLLSNCLFMVKTAVRLNPSLLPARGLLILVNAALPFIPIVFFAPVLNEITIGGNMRAFSCMCCLWPWRRLWANWR